MALNRRLAAVAGGTLLVLALGWLMAGPAAGQKVMKKRVAVGFAADMPAGGSPSQYSAIRLVEKSEYRAFINAATEAIKDAIKEQKEGRNDAASKDWNEAVTALQTILDNKDDFYAQVKQRDTHGQETVRWTSVKFEANNLLGSMPAEGLDVYEIRFGAKAMQMLVEAKRKADWEQLADVAQRFLHTRAGTEAAELLATYFLDRGQFFTAALRYEQLLNMNPKRVKIADLTFFKAALAYRRAGDVKKADEFWKRLEARAGAEGGLKISDQLVTLAQLQQVLNEIPRPEAVNPHDWPLIRGNITNSAQANGSPPLLDLILWQRPLCGDKELLDEGAQAAEKRTKERYLDPAVQAATQPVLPGFFPITSGHRLLYRTYSDIRAVFLQDEKDGQGKIVHKAGELDWVGMGLDGGLFPVLSDTDVSGTIQTWLGTYLRQPATMSLVYENSLLGTIATDHRFVYAVDDLAVPALPVALAQYQWNQQMMPPKVKELVLANKLVAFELNSGKQFWQLGGKSAATGKEDAFAESHFLGVPLAVGGKLYVLNEKNQGPQGEADLRLVCIDPVQKDADHKPKVISVQELGRVQQQHRITHDMTRRLNAAHLAYGEGILVCPTHAGQVLGVDLLSRSLAWAYPYREQVQRTQQIGQVPGMVAPGFPGGFNPNVAAVSTANWRSSPPVIQDGKVVFTAPDASSVHCISLRDGVPAWKAPQMDGDQYLAGVFNGKVVVVGKNAVRILRLSDGTQQWYIPINGEPSGQGVACRNVYYLPVKSRDKNGEIIAIDLARGAVKARNRATKTGTPPGNLLFHEGAVVAQTVDDIIVYPQLVAQLELASAAVKADPNNPEKLFKRGEFRLYDGQVQDAVDDLHLVLTKNPPAPLVRQTKDRLYEALTDLFQLNFGVASNKYLSEYRELCNVPDTDAERQNRLAKFLRLVGKGREAQGKLVEAFKMYREFGDLPLTKEQGVASLEDPTHKVPTPVWLRGRISAMMAKASPEQREPLEKQIAAEWKAVEAKKDIDAMRTFVGMFDVPFKVGREARLRLAEAIMDKKDRGAYLEAELNLEQLRVAGYRKDPEVGGRALAALARLEERKGNADAMKLAAAYYRELGRDFPNVIVKDGKTGADLLNELATDKRFLPYLEETGALWHKARIAAREVAGMAADPSLQGFLFYPAGDLTPLTRNHRLLLDTNNATNPVIRFVDLTTNTVRWTQSLGTDPTNLNFRVFGMLYQQGQGQVAYADAPHRFVRVKGHLAVFQIGVMAYGVDLDSAKVLWQHGLVTLPNTMNVNGAVPNAEGSPELIVFNQATQQQARIRIGHVAAVEASYVALITHKGLELLDPLSGHLLWSKMDVPAQTRVFGDDQHLYLVDSRAGGVTGAGRVLRASNGEPVTAPDFGYVYQNRLHVQGGTILASMAGKDGLSLRSYDILTGKDRWTRAFAAKAVRLRTDDPALTGVIEPEGKLIVLDASDGRELLATSVLQGRVKADDLKDLHEPLLLADGDRFYLALNHALDPKETGGFVGSNFASGLRCAPVNGWFMAFHRKGGQNPAGKDVVSWKKGELHWHSYKPIVNQQVVLEQFQSLPVVLFSARYYQLLNEANNARRWVASTQSIHKATGRMVWDSGFRDAATPQYQLLSIDLKAGTINLVGYGVTLQHYIDDGRKTTGVSLNKPLVVPQGLIPPVSIQEQLALTDPIDQARPQACRCKVYNVHLTTGMAYSIVLESNQFDAYLRLEDDRGNKLDENDDGGPGFGLNSRIVHRASRTGSFRVIATSLVPSIGAFTLSVRPLAEGAIVLPPQLRRK
jgi:tetratricopeptide (TPR) repeat protein